MVITIVFLIFTIEEIFVLFYFIDDRIRDQKRNEHIDLKIETCRNHLMKIRENEDTKNDLHRDPREVERTIFVPQLFIILL